jgi:hypothetical protein
MSIRKGICVSLFAALALPATAFAQAVYTVNLSLGAVLLADGLLAKQKVDDTAIVNLAMARPVDAVVPDNEVLALLFDCATGDASLDVFDLVGNVVLENIATSGNEDLLTATNGGAFALVLDLKNVNGGALNDIDGGYLVVTAQFEPGPMGCPSGIKAGASGVIDVTVTDDLGTEAFSVVVLKGKAGFSKEPITQLP